MLKNSTLYLFILFLTVSCSGLRSAQKKRLNQNAALEVISKKNNQIKTVRGRAWIKAKMKGESQSFPAIIAYSNEDSCKGCFRLEGIDPVGVTHQLFILDRSGNFTWADFDQKLKNEIHEHWSGIPLNMLGSFFLGQYDLQNQNENFEWQDGSQTLKIKKNWGFSEIQFRWIEPGPHPEVQKIKGESHYSSNLQFEVSSEKYLDYNEFYLPEVVKISSEKKNFSLEISWRERKLNEQIMPQVFEIPASVKNFQPIK